MAVKTLRHAGALRMITDAAVDYPSYSKRFGKRAFVLPDGSLLTEIIANRSWRLWPSPDEYEAAVDGVVSGRVIDPLKDAVGDAGDFLRHRQDLARDFARVTAGVRRVDQVFEEVEAKVLSKSGEYWTGKPERLRGLLAFVGEEACRRFSLHWAEADSGVALRRGEKSVNVGAILLGNADEAKRGEFSLEDVLHEIGRAVR